MRAGDEVLPPDTDTALCEAGYATLTTLVGIAESWPPAESVGDVTQRPVPGAAFHPAQTLPDVTDRHTLHSREHA